MKDRRCPYRIVKAEGKPDEFGKCYATGCPYFVEERYDINACKWIHEHCRKVEKELSEPKMVNREDVDYINRPRPRRFL